VPSVACASAKLCAEAHVAFQDKMDCAIGSTCANGPERLVVFRKFRPDGCEPDRECSKEAASVVTGDSVHFVADTVYVYRDKNRREEPSTYCANPGECGAHKSDDLEAYTSTYLGKPFTVSAKMSHEADSLIRPSVDGVPRCTAAQAQAKLRAANGRTTYWPRCEE
jgi:hypothetical protein